MRSRHDQDPPERHEPEPHGPGPDGLAAIAHHLEREDPRLATALRRGRPRSPVAAAAVAIIIAGTAGFVLALSTANTVLFVLGLVALLAGWTVLLVAR